MNQNLSENLVMEPMDGLEIIWVPDEKTPDKSKLIWVPSEGTTGVWCRKCYSVSDVSVLGINTQPDIKTNNIVSYLQHLYNHIMIIYLQTIWIILSEPLCVGHAAVVPFALYAGPTLESFLCLGSYWSGGVSVTNSSHVIGRCCCFRFQGLWATHTHQTQIII